MRRGLEVRFRTRLVAAITLVTKSRFSLVSHSEHIFQSNLVQISLLDCLPSCSFVPYFEWNPKEPQPGIKFCLKFHKIIGGK